MLLFITYGYQETNISLEIQRQKNDHIRRIYCKLKKYGTADGIKAISLYVIYVAVLFIQGYISTTNLSVRFLNLLQIVYNIGQAMLV